jgi:hypothetical protein
MLCYSVHYRAPPQDGREYDEDEIMYTYEADDDCPRGKILAHSMRKPVNLMLVRDIYIEILSFEQIGTKKIVTASVTKKSGGIVMGVVRCLLILLYIVIALTGPGVWIPIVYFLSLLLWYPHVIPQELWFGYSS